MLPLTLDDLLPLEEYARRRREFFDSLGRYVDRYRRVRIGPKMLLVFENRQTLWHRLHEVIRVARLSGAERLQKELDCYNSLLPGPGTLQAALLVEVENEAELPAELAAWKHFNGRQLRFHLGRASLWATLVTCRPEDACIGAAHWIQFKIDNAKRRLLADLRIPCYLEITLPEYRHRSDTLSDEIRQSLVDDLELSPANDSRPANDRQANQSPVKDHPYV